MKNQTLGKVYDQWKLLLDRQKKSNLRLCLSCFKVADLILKF